MKKQITPMTLIRKTSQLILLFLLQVSILKSQNAVNPVTPLLSNPQASFEDILQAYKATLFTQMNDTPKVLKQVQRFAVVNENRLSTNVPNGYNRITAAADAFARASKNRNSVCQNKNGTFNGSWEFLGPKKLGLQDYGLVLDIWVNPADDDEIMVGTYGGVFKTTNANDPNGSDWVNITDNSNVIPSGFIAMTIAVDPTNTDNIYVGTKYHFELRDFHNWNDGDAGIGMITSTDGGATWTIDNDFNTVCGISGCLVQKLQYNQDATVLYALTSKGIFAKPTTTNTWQLIDASIYGRNVELVPGNNNKCWISEAGDKNPNSNNVYEVTYTSPSTFSVQSITSNFPSLSIGNGDTMGICYHIEISSYNANTLYAMTNRALSGLSKCSDEYSGQNCWYPGPEAVLWRYDVANSTWTMINRSSTVPHELPTFAYGGYSFQKSKTNADVMYLGRDVLYISKDRGLTFQQISTYWADAATKSHADVQNILLYSTSTTNDGINDIVYAGTDGGLSIKKQGVNPNFYNATTDFSGNGIGCNQFYGLAVSEAGGIMMGGCMHDGLHSYEPQLNPQWHLTEQGDKFQTVFDKTNPQIAFDKQNTFYNDILIGTMSGNGIILDRSSYLSSGQVTSNQDIRKESNNTQFVHDSKGRIYYPKARLWRMDGIVLKNVSGEQNQFIPNFNGDDLQLLVDNKTNIHRLAIDLDDPSLPSSAPNANIIHGYISYTFDGTALGAKRLYSRKSGITSPSASNSWFDVTPSAAFGNKLTDIEMDNLHHNRVWVSLGDVTWGNNNIPRVMYSDDWGDHWINMSNGLPGEIPINCISHQKGTDIVYAATDIGVFMLNYNATTPSLSYWTCFNDGAIGQPKLPPTMQMSMDINYCSGKLVISTHGRGIWQSDLYTSNPVNVALPGVANEITANTTWSDTKYIEGSILVKSGATLTITGIPNFTDNTSTTTINMAKMGAIYVEKGAKLEVIGAKITNACNSNWYGIQAFGDGTLAQEYNSTTTRYDHQGFVVMNDAIIEHVEEAFKNYGGSLGANGLNTGGIIAANNTVFLNNRRSAEFLKYDNTNSNGMVIKDKSYFTDCKFLLDANHRQDFDAHISMWAVNNIQLIGNEFKNNSTLKDYGAEEAIQTFDASYNVDNSGNQSTLFEGFNRAIKSSSFSKERPFSIAVQNATFDKNQIGINIDNVYGATIKGNTINIGERRSDLNGTWYASLGTLLESTTNFIYCSNTHNKLYNSPNSTVTQATEGIEAHNTGHDDLVIEKNSYSNLEVGTDFDYECGNPTNGGQSGAYFRWNQNNNNTRYDFSFLADAIIRKIQSANTATNNVATGNTFSGGITDIYHESITNSNAPVDYYHSNTGNEIPTTVFNVNPISTTISQIENPDCDKSIMADKSIKNQITNVELSTLKNEYNVHEILFDAYQQLYNQLVDGGNTAGHIADIESSNATQAMQIRTEMLALSPYVSAEVLRTLAEENILPNSILLEIILANPDASQRIEFIKYLQFEKTNPLPEYMITLIENSWDGSTPRSIMERSMAFEHYKMSSLKDQILLSYKYGNNYDEVDQLLWMNKLPSLSNRYDVIEYYLGKKQYTNAEAILNSLPTQYMMNEFENNEFATYNTLYNFKKNLQQNNVSIHQLDSPRISQLKAIADNGLYSFARTMARDAMCFFYKVCYPYERKELPTPIMGKTKISDNKETPKEITVYPNPAKEYVAFYYNLTDGNKVINLIVSDVTGKLIYQSTLSNTSGQHIWDVKNISNGNYIYSITTKTGLKYSGKIVVQK